MRAENASARRLLVLRKGIVRLDAMIKAQQQLCDSFDTQLQSAVGKWKALNGALEDMLSWLPCTEVHVRSAEELKAALDDAVSALGDAQSLVSGAEAESPEPASSARVDKVFELVRTMTAASRHADEELVQALSLLRNARSLEARERSLRIHSIQRL